ncbi:penicillin acylase family protein [Stenotrophomonas indicatrix]|uniref:penicillin acylase family protein n=1 Tax=Stenotrophomonas indicatrix TaxID=2045451 RepID=UPI00264C66AA|nr:penicillin acylase family protein [Stenotrophomonas indicatrix]MDN8642946.1 penicillin acylase family protein [Stenotrophomonas indicatrix]MDN8654139.1 penicillin acylase family protein [Stenotrophomonas indicatrix]
MRRTWRWILGVLVAIVLLAVLVLWLLLRGSLAELEGERPLPGLATKVTVERDALGVVTITAGNKADALRALGRVHAQERYFEMDLMRRSAAGELSALFGAKAIEADKRMRVHRLRARTEAHLQDALGSDPAAVRAYVDGVNQGLGSLAVRPWAYLLLRQAPQPWQASDSVLAGLAMYADLQDPSNQSELALERIRAVVPPALYALLANDGSEWDAPLAGAARGNAPLPDASQLDLRTLKAATGAAAEDADAVGSNNFAVAGALTADGRAIVADDMHLGLRAPSLWFRVRLRYPDPQAAGGQVDVSGFSLPGVPAVIVGSNGHVAWGFTNSYIDTADFRTEPADAAVTVHEERIVVAGGADVLFPVRETAWGPILHTHADGSGDALRWVAQLPGAVRMDFADMARATDLDQALQIADHAGIPAQNLVIGDRSGRIAWRLIGARPDRGPGCTPLGFNDNHRNPGCAPWPIRSDAAPSLVDPASHRLWTANSRVVDEATLATVGNGGYDLGARGRQIRDLLATQAHFDEHDLLAIQLDDRAVFLQRWWVLLHQVVEHSDDPALKRLGTASSHWEGRAAIDSVSYRVVREFRTQVLDTLTDALLAPARAPLGEDFLAPRLAQLEGVAWPMLQQRPANLLPPAYTSWDALLADAARRTEAELSAQGPLAHRSWGERNTAAICHPVARALPAFASRWLCMPADPLPGDRDMPRVQTPAFGASQRMVVSPGHEADGIVHMPGGQSGHPLSPYWGAGHEDWVHGRPTPFLPGKAQHTLTLLPAR